MPNQGSSTKDRIADAVKALAVRKSFHKITINDIAKECGMTRENFYYHFRDKYDIVNWIFLREVLDPVSGVEDMTLWMKELMFRANAGRHIFVRVINDEGREVVRDIFYPAVEERIRGAVDAALDPAARSSKKEKRDLAAAFFTNAFIDFLIRNAIERSIPDPNRFEENFEFLICNYLPFVRIKKENMTD